MSLNAWKKYSWSVIKFPLERSLAFEISVKKSGTLSLKKIFQVQSYKMVP